MPLPRSVQEIRQANGGLENLTDFEIAQHEFSNYQSYYPSFEEFSKSIGFDTGGKWGNRLSASIDSYQANMLGLAESVTGSETIAGMRKGNEREAMNARQLAASQGAIMDRKDINGVGDALDWVGGLAIDSLPYAAEAAVGGIAGRVAAGGMKLGARALSKNAASTIGGVAASYPSAVGDILQNQREAGDGQTDLLYAAVGGVPYAAANAVGITGAAARGELFRSGVRSLDSLGGFGGAAARTAVSGAKTALNEGAGETFQEGVNQYFGRMAVDDNATLFDADAMDRYQESFIAGAALGGAAGGALGGWRRSESYLPPGQTVDDGPADLLNGAPNWQTTQGFDPVERPVQQNPLGDLTPEWETSQGFEDLRTTRRAVDPNFVGPEARGQAGTIRRAPEGSVLDASQMYPAVGDAPLVDPNGNPVPSRAQDMPAVEFDDPAGLVANAPNWQTTQGFDPVERPAPVNPLGDTTPDWETSQGFEDIRTPRSPDGQAIVRQSEAEQLDGADLYQSVDDPAAVESRRVASEQQAQKAEQERQAEAEKAKQAELVKEAASLGIKGTKSVEMFGRLKAAQEAGEVTESDFNYSIEDLRKRVPARVGRLLDANAETKANQAAAKEEETAKLLAAVQKPLAERGAAQAPKQAPAGDGKIVGGLNRNQWVQKAKAASKVNRARLLDLLGFAEDTDGNIIGDGIPRTLEQVAEREAARTGKKVTRQAVAISLKRAFPGINVEAVNAATAAPAAQEVSSAEIGEAASDGANPLEGFRVEDSVSKAVGQGLVEGRQLTKSEKEAEAAADKLLGTKKGAKQREDYNPEADETLAKRQAIADAQLQREFEQLEEKMGSDIDIAATDWNDSKWSGAPDFDALTVRQKMEYLYEYENQLRETGNQFEPLESLIQNLSRDFQQAADAAFRPEAAVEDQVDTGRNEGDRQPESPDAGKVGSAQTAWTTLARSFPMMPAWESLSTKQQDRVADMVQRETFNLAAANTIAAGTTVVNKDVLAPDVPVNKDVLGEGPAALQSKSTSGQTDNDAAVSFEFDDLETMVSGVDLVRPQLAELGIESALDHVRDWKLVNNPNDPTEGEISFDQGGYAISLNIGREMQPAKIARTLRHEVAHAMDMAPHGGVYSAHPDMKVNVIKGQVYPAGPVAAEIIRLYKRGHPVLRELLSYPLDYKRFAKEMEQSSQIAPALRVQMEMYAQIMAFYTADANTREYLQDQAPLTAQFLQNTIESFKNAPNRQVKKHADADARRAAYRAAYPGSSRGGVGPSNAGGQRVEGRQTAALQSISTSTGVPTLDNLPSAISTAIQSLKDGTSWVALRSMFTKDLVNLAKSALPSAGKYLSAMEKIQVERGRMERTLDSILEDFRKLPSALQGTGPSTVNALIKDMTVDKKWAFKPSWVPDAAVDSALAERFNAMPAQAQEVIKRVFEHGHKNLLEMKKAAMDNAASEYDAQLYEAKKDGDDKLVEKLTAKKQKALRDFESLFKMNSGWPYAPLKRFGKYVVMGVSQAYQDAKEAGDVNKMRELESDPAHYYVAFTETKQQSRKLAADIASTYKIVDHFEKLEQADSWLGGRDIIGSFNRLRTIIRQSDDLGEGTKAGKQMEDIMRQLYLTMLAENTARKSEINRRTVAGADNDMMRAFATQGRATAHFVAGLKTNGAVTDNLAQMASEARMATGERDKPQAYYNEIMRRHSMSLQYQPQGFVDKAMAGTSIWMLLTNPSYFLINATQPWMTTMPMLAAKHSVGRSGGELLRAYRDIVPLVKDLTLQQDDYSKLPKDVRKAVEELANRGVIDISLESMLGNFRSTSDGVVGNALEKSVTKLRNASQFVEAINRLTTAVASYRLERQRGATDAAAIDYAAKVIYDTHGDYSGFNAPRFMRQGFGRLATQFRKFQLIQLSMFARYINQAFKGASAEERAIGKRALMFNMAHLFASGGLMGLPGFAAISWVVSKAFGDDDEPADAEATLRRAIDDKGTADLLLKGLPKLAGFDVSGRIGAGGMLSLLPYTDVKVSRDGYGDIVTGALGPFFGGVMPRAMDGLDLLSKGDMVKGMEQLLPSGFSNALRATRYATEGLTRRNGDVVLSPDEITLLDAMASALGLPSNKITDRNFLANAQYNADEFYRNRTTELKKRYADAVRNGSERERREAIEEWQETQAARRKLGYTVQPMSTLLRAPTEQAKRESQAVGGVATTENNRRFVTQLME